MFQSRKYIYSSKRSWNCSCISLRHLVIARGLADRIGEGRAHWSLANAYTALKRYDLALRCSKRHRQIAFELGDNTGFMTAHLMIGGIRCLMKSVQTEFSGVNRDNQTDSQAILSKNSILTRTTSVPSSSSSSSSAGLSHRQQNHILDINTTRLNNKTNNNNNSTCENSTVNLPPNSTNGTVVTLPFSSSSITGTCIIDDNNELKIRPSNSTLDNWINCNNKHGLTPINPSNSTVALTTTTTTTTTPTVSDNSIIKPIVQQIHSQTFQPYIHKPILNDTNHTIDSYDYQVDNDIELDKDLERELLESYEGILETVEFVTVTEDGQTIISQMGCLDVPTPVSSESKKENMVEFYLSTPAFRPNLSQQTDLSNLGDIEENFESIESMSQMNRNPNLPNNDLAYNSNIDSGNTHTTTTTTTTTTTGTSTVTATATPAATASLVEEGRLVDQQEMFFSLLLESQSRRMDEQRCYLRSSQDTGTIQSTDETVTTNSPQEFIHIQSSENFYHTPDDNNNSPLQSHQLGANEEAFFDLIEGVQGDRMNDQRANLSVFPGLRSGPGLHFFEGGNRYFGSTNSMFKSTSSGASDGLPEPKLFSSNSESVTGLLSDATCCMQKAGSSSGGGEGGTRGRRGHIVVSSTGGGGGGGDLDDEFLEMIFRIQTCTRINDQRSNLPDPLSQLHSQTNPTNHQSDNGNTTHITSQTVVTVSNSHRELISYTSSDVITCNLTNRCSAPAILDDNDDLFALIQRVQSTRLDEQRCYPPLQQSQSSCLSTSLSSTSSCIDRSENTISLDTTSGNIVRKSSGRRRVGSRNSKRTNHQNK
ncbi:unnamed protein product [Heterobilharzia americana]|nr:unnamed protein product [Heterobilharzia americana]